jgi:uncharacterized protein (TIGR02996 family)
MKGSDGMSERETLIGAIAAHPREDIPRLAFADWLEENGEPERAEFVRVQCEADRRRAGTRRRSDLLNRAEELLAEHQREWLGSWSEHLIDWEFRRGFLSRVRMSATAFLAQGNELFRFEPVGRLELVDDRRRAFDGTPEPLDEDTVREVVAHSAFANVRDCAVVPHRFLEATPVSAWLTAIAANPKIVRLRRFGPVGNFGYNYDGYDGRTPRRGVALRALTAFCRAPHLHRLRVLNLSQCPVVGRNRQEALAERIAAATFSRNLRTLKLANCSLPLAALAHLATAPVFGKLRSLDIHGNAHDPDEWLPVFRTATLKAVTKFAIGALNIPAYTRSALARQIRSLTVHSSEDLDRDTTPDRNAWFELLQVAPPPLQLDLRCHNPGEEVFAEIHRRNWLAEVRELSLAGDSQYEVYSGATAGACALFGGNVMRRLTALRLHEIGDRQVLTALACWPGLARLESLELTDDYHGRLNLTNFPVGPSVARLRTLRGVIVSTDEDVERFLTLPGLENLTSLQLSFLGHYDRATHRYTDAVVLTEAAVDRLLRSERLARITNLTLGFGYTRRIEFHVVPQFSDPGLMPRLRTVRLYVGRDGRSDDRPRLDTVRARFGNRLSAW